MENSLAGEDVDNCRCLRQDKKSHFIATDPPPPPKKKKIKVLKNKTKTM